MSLQKQILADVIRIAIDNKTNPAELKGRAKGAYQARAEAFSQLVAKCLLGQSSHTHVYNAYDLGGKSKLTELMGSEKSFNTFNAECQAFISTGLYKQNVFNMAYTLNPAFIADINKLVDADSVSVTDYTKWAVIVPDNVKVETYCVTSSHGLTKLMLDTTTSPKERLYAWSLRETYKQHNNTIPQYYREGSKTNRLYGVGQLSISTIPRRIREHVLADYVEYDLNAACYAILLSLASDASLYPTIKQYVNDTKSFRKKIATEAGASVQDVKMCFIHKGFGSSLTYKTGIANEVAMTTVTAIKNTALFTAFNVELKALKNSLVSLYPEQYEYFKTSREVYADEHSKAGQYKGQFLSTYICWLYQKYEIQIIEIINRELEDSNHCVLIHDAIYTKEILCRDTLSKLIESELNINVRIG